jgi:hypothetical protein
VTRESRERHSALGLRVGLHVGLPLAIGLLAYAAWRSKDIRVVAWMSRIAPRGVDAVQGSGASRLPAILLGSLPDAAWAWAFGAALALVWRHQSRRQTIPWLVAGGFAALSAELAQAIHVLPGTFDVADLVAIALGYALGAVTARAGAPSGA